MTSAYCVSDFMVTRATCFGVVLLAGVGDVSASVILKFILGKPIPSSLYRNLVLCSDLNQFQ